MTLSNRIKDTFVRSMDEVKYNATPEKSPYAKWIVGHPERQKVMPHFVPTLDGKPLVDVTYGLESVEKAVEFIDTLRWEKIPNQEPKTFSILVYFGKDLADTLSYEELIK